MNTNTTDITTVSTETLAELIAEQYERIMQSQNNLNVIRAELARRKATPAKESEKADES